MPTCFDRLFKRSKQLVLPRLTGFPRHTHKDTHSFTITHARTHARARTHTHKHTHTCIHTHAYTHMHTHKHTHTFDINAHSPRGKRKRKWRQLLQRRSQRRRQCKRRTLRVKLNESGMFVPCECVRCCDILLKKVC
jgi:hypothetical protein